MKEDDLDELLRADKGKSRPMTQIKDCTWTPDNEENNYDAKYNTGCGRMFILSEGPPAKNGMKYCAFCGGKLIEGKT